MPIVASAKHCLLPTEGSAPLVSLRTAEASEKHCLLATEESAPLVPLRTADASAQQEHAEKK